MTSNFGYFFAPSPFCVEVTYTESLPPQSVLHRSQVEHSSLRRLPLQPEHPPLPADARPRRRLLPLLSAPPRPLHPPYLRRRLPQVGIVLGYFKNMGNRDS